MVDLSRICLLGLLLVGCAGKMEPAPAVLSAADALAPAATAKKDEDTRKLGEEWSALAAFVPEALAKVQSRLTALHQKSSPPALGEAMSIWSKARAAYAADNLTEAVSSAKTADLQVRAAAAQLNLNLSPGPGAAAAP